MIDKKKFARTVIIGNSGSGKSFLANQLAETIDTKIVHFDKHFWEPGGFSVKRPSEIVSQEIKSLSFEENWIMEGVFGDLATLVLPRATALIFLNKNWEECCSALMLRDSESKHSDLLTWAKAYCDRETLSSLKGHQKIFSEYSGWKQEIRDRQTSANFIANLR